MRRFLRGADYGRGVDPNASGRTALYGGGVTGDDVGTYQSDSYQIHDHSIQDPGHSHQQLITVPLINPGYTGIRLAWNQDGSGYAGLPDGLNNVPSNTGITVNSNGGSTETRPENISVFYIIKY